RLRPVSSQYLNYFLIGDLLSTGITSPTLRNTRLGVKSLRCRWRKIKAGYEHRSMSATRISIRHDPCPYALTSNDVADAAFTPSSSGSLSPRVAYIRIPTDVNSWSFSTFSHPYPSYCLPEAARRIRGSPSEH